MMVIDIICALFSQKDIIVLLQVRLSKIVGKLILFLI